MSKLINYIFSTVLALLLISSCNYEEGFKEITVDNDYTVSIPHYLKKTDRLSPTGDFQYENKFRNFYVICVDEVKNNESLENYTGKLLHTFEDRLDDYEVKKDTINNINGLPVKYYELKGSMTGKSLYYILVTIEGPDKFYQLCIWTTNKKKDQHLADFSTIAGSFKLLNSD